MFNPWVWKIPWRKKWQPIPVFLPGKSHGQRSLAGYNPWGCKRFGHNLTTKQHQLSLFKLFPVFTKFCTILVPNSVCREETKYGPLYVQYLILPPTISSHDFSRFSQGASPNSQACFLLPTGHLHLDSLQNLTIHDAH